MWNWVAHIATCCFKKSMKNIPVFFLRCVPLDWVIKPWRNVQWGVNIHIDRKIRQLLFISGGSCFNIRCRLHAIDSTVTSNSVSALGSCWYTSKGIYTFPIPLTSNVPYTLNTTRCWYAQRHVKVTAYNGLPHAALTKFQSSLAAAGHSHSASGDYYNLPSLIFQEKMFTL